MAIPLIKLNSIIELKKLEKQLLPILSAAAQKARELYQCHKENALSHHFKEDKSIVTSADLTIETFLSNALKKLTAEIPIVAEEEHDNKAQMNKAKTIHHDSFWLIDPIDGSKHFWNLTGEFSINIALIYQKKPLLALISSPIEKIIYSAIKGEGSFLRNEGEAKKIKLQTRPANPDKKLAILCGTPTPTKGRIIELLKKIPNAEITARGSAIKFCKIAAGQADLYARLKSIMEWDTAAGQLILEEAGGAVLIREGTPLFYHKPNFKNPSFLAIADKKWLDYIDFSFFFYQNEQINK